VLAVIDSLGKEQCRQVMSLKVSSLWGRSALVSL
jgi:hypothetical protein